MAVSNDTSGAEAHPWWPESVITLFALFVAATILTFDLSGNLCCSGPPKLLPSGWALSRYEFELLIGCAAIALCIGVFDLRRFKFDGTELVIMRLFVPGTPRRFQSNEIVAVSRVQLGSASYFKLACRSGGTLKVPARYVGAERFVAAVQKQPSQA